MIKIYKLDENAKETEVGTVAVIGGQAVFGQFKDRGIESWLKRGIKTRSRTIPTSQGEEFVRALPRFLHGDRLWAVNVM